MKTISMVVTIEFYDEVDSVNSIKEVVNNVCDAIVSHANSAGIAPPHTFTHKVTISVDNTQYQIERIIF